MAQLFETIMLICFGCSWPISCLLYTSFFHTGSQSFAGLENYKDVIHNEAFQLAAKNTGVFIGVCIPLLMILSLALALFIYENPRTESFLKTGFLIPMAIPVASVVLMWKFLFENRGIINGLLVDLGLSPVNWMDSNAAFWILVGSYIWKNLGYNIILWLASLSAVNPALREAAMLDGAGFWQRFYYVFFPQLKKAAFVIIVLAVLNSFKVFREAYLVAGDYPWENKMCIRDRHKSIRSSRQFLSEIGARTITKGELICQDIENWADQLLIEKLC